jgi:hypothetical protein
MLNLKRSNSNVLANLSQKKVAPVEDNTSHEESFHNPAPHVWNEDSICSDGRARSSITAIREDLADDSPGREVLSYLAIDHETILNIFFLFILTLNTFYLGKCRYSENCFV